MRRRRGGGGGGGGRKNQGMKDKTITDLSNSMVL